MKRVLVVEDDRAIRVGVRGALVSEGLRVVEAKDGDEGLALARAERFDLIVLDVMLPGRSGFEVLRALREAGDDTDVILLTARGDELDRVAGFELGADDYVTKPFSLRELLARVKARLRRTTRRAPEEATPRVLELGRARADLEAFTLRDPRGQEHRLAPKEVAMLQLLWRERGKVVSRAQFLREVWDLSPEVGTRTVDTHVLNLRHKLEVDPRAPQVLVTVHGAGYKLVEGAEPE
jgi:DNA-binding response OmpR family regulator